MPKTIVAPAHAEPKVGSLLWWWNLGVKGIPILAAAVMFLGGVLLSHAEAISENGHRIEVITKDVNSLKEALQDRQQLLLKISEKLTEIQVSLGRLEERLNGIQKPK